MALPQRVNFFDVLERPVKDWFGLNFMLVLLLLFVVLIGLWGMFMVSNNSGLHKQLSDIKHKAERLQKNVNELAAVQQRSVNKNIFAQKIVILKDEYASKARVVSALDLHPWEGGKGFSQQMKGLASHGERGMWFTTIKLDDSGEDIELTGYTRNPASVPRYLKALQGEPTFSGHQFTQVGIRPKTTDKNLYRFDLVTTPKAQ